MRARRAIRLLAAAVLFGAAVVAMGTDGPARAAAPTVVYPTGSFPTDVQNVQAAEDRGGLVLLKATDRSGSPRAFNFGPATLGGTGVNLTTDVSLEGETVSGHQTTIEGGFTPILGFVPVRSHISGIRFQSPLSHAILLLASTGTQLVGNRVDGVIGVHVRVPSGLVFTFGDGIDLFGDNGSISGTAKIADNVITNLSSDFSVGIQLDTISATTTIMDNVVDYPASNGFVENDGIDALRAHSPVSMIGNSVHLGTGSADALPIGLFIAGDGDARYQVIGNSITSEHPNAVGIIARGDIPGVFGPTNGAVISNNSIRIASTTAFTGAIQLLEGVNASVVTGNENAGTGDLGLAISWAALPSPADGNKFVNNNLAQFSAITADVFLDTNSQDTTVVGQCRSFIDLGTENTVACIKPITAGEHHPSNVGRGLSSNEIDAAVRALARTNP